MTKTAVLLGGDRRQSCLARQLQACGFAVRTCGVPGCPDTAPTLPACVRGAELLILPMPALRAPDRIRADPDDLPLGPALDAAAPGALVCGGLLDAAVPALQAHSLRWFDYARDETLALENAELTAEAALPPLLARLPCPLRGSRILILGFGRIGKRLAWKLHTLGAAVTVAARRPPARRRPADPGRRDTRRDRPRRGRSRRGGWQAPAGRRRGGWRTAARHR